MHTYIATAALKGFERHATVYRTGPLAHPVERVHGMDEVRGSSPLGSTMFDDLSLRIALGIAAIISLFLYFVTNRGRARYFLETAIDRKIPFIPAAVVPYMLFIPCVITTLWILFSTPYAIEGYTALIIGILMGSALRLMARTGIRQPQIRRKDIFSRIIHWLYLHDDRARTFPSTHVLVASILGFYVALAFPMYAVSVVSLAVLIILSTLLIKQHYIIDVIGGFLVAGGAVATVSWLFAAI